MFGTKHIIILCICLLVGILFYIATGKFTLKMWMKLFLGIGIASEVTKICYYIIRNEAVYGGYLPKTDLPFHLCSIQIIFIIILNVIQNEKFKRIILSFMLPSCLIGGIAALLIPTDSAINGGIIITIQYFTYHVMIISFAIYLYRCKEITWTIKDFGSSLAFLAVMGFIAIYINSMAYDVSHYTVLPDGTKIVEMASRPNFMYVVDPPQKGLPFLNEDHGWAVYMIHYSMTAIFAIALCYIKPIINAIKKKVKKVN